MKNIFAFVLTGIYLAGCGTFDQTMVVPEKDGVYHAIAEDYTEFNAQKSALKRAAKTCKKHDMEFIVNDQKTYQRGAETKPSHLTDGKSIADQTIPNRGASSLYKAVVTFVCVDDPQQAFGS